VGIDLYPAVDARPAVSVTVRADQSEVARVIGDAFAESFYLKTVSYDADVYFQKSEFLYLLDMRPGELIGAGDIVRALSYFFKKNKFQSITITCTHGRQGADLHWNFVGSWTFAKLKLHGVMLGKDMYRQYYLLEPGEQFDQEKHDLSLVKIKEAFAAQGYFNGTVVESRIEKDRAIKSIVVHLSLNKGERFAIGSISLDVEKDPSVVQAEVVSMRDAWYRRFFKPMANAPYGKKLLNDQITAFKTYLFQKGFVHSSIELHEQINYQKKKVDLSFSIHLHRKKEFVFLGNRYFSVDELFNQIALFGRSAWLLPVAMVAADIKKLYHQRGFWSVVVEPREEENRCFFIIQEGGQAVVHRVMLEGVENAIRDELVDRFFGSFIKKKQYNAAELESAIEAFTAFYVAQGFLDFKITGRTFERSDSQNGYTLILTVNVGERSYCSSVTIEGFSDLEREWPFAPACGETIAKPFDNALILEQRKWLVDHFNRQGYTHTTVTPEFQREGQQISVVWKVHLGIKNICFGKTIVMGNTTFPFEYIVRELCYTHGQLWDKQLLKRSVERLKELEIFDSIHLYPYRTAHDDAENPILLKVQKDDPFELRLRVGFAAQQVSKSLHTAGLTYRAGGAFLIKNPFNYGDRLLFEADVTRSSRTTLVQYRQPWLFNLPVRTIVQAYSNRYEQPGLIGPVKNLYDVTQQGFLVGVSGRYAHGESSMNIGIEWMETTVCNNLSSRVCSVDELARAINFTPWLLDKNIPYFLVEPTVLLDYVDNRLDPKCGSFTLFSCKGMVPLNRLHSHAYFVRVSVEQSFFMPFYSTVFALRVRCGHIFNQHLKNIVPIERFYLGGANSVRSYETDRCPPLGVFVDDNECVQYVPRGGKTLVNMNVEMRFPIYKQVRGVLFQDCGYLSGNFLNWNEESALVAGTGFGLRYITPLGPVRFDIAWKWHRSYPHESPYAWFVTLGQAF
jgi:outer membrane protein assembly factor BamA